MRAIRNILATLIILSFVQEVLGQEMKNQIDSEYFLIGTLSDYIGRHNYPEVINRVDSYYKYETSLAYKIDSIFGPEYLDLELKILKDSNRFEIYSEQLTKIIDSFYQYKPSGSYTMDSDTIYWGKLRQDKFQTNLQKLSFLTGVYVRFGETNDSTYCIRIHNSLSKAEICEQFLHDLNCSQVKYEILSNYIPVSHILYFQPSEKLKDYLTEYMYLRKQLHNDWLKQIKNMIGEENYNKYLEEELLDKKNNNYAR